MTWNLRRNLRERDWRTAMARARAHVTDAELDTLIGRAIAAIRAQARTARLVYAWSGGKNSQVLAWLMDHAGVGPCVLAVTAGLEWPAMGRWRALHMPVGCETLTVPIDLQWLADHPRMLFGQGTYTARWAAYVHHRAQARYLRREAADVIAVGRRRADGGYTGPAGGDRYIADGVTRWSPLADWTHEQLFAFVDRHGIALPPCYRWPRGYQVGAAPWPARPAPTTDYGFAECWVIDSSVVAAAADVLPQAADWLRRTGRSTVAGGEHQ